MRGGAGVAHEVNAITSELFDSTSSGYDTT